MKIKRVTMCHMSIILIMVSLAMIARSAAHSDFYQDRDLRQQSQQLSNCMPIENSGQATRLVLCTNTMANKINSQHGIHSIIGNELYPNRQWLNTGVYQARPGQHKMVFSTDRARNTRTPTSDYYGKRLVPGFDSRSDSFESLANHVLSSDEKNLIASQTGEDWPVAFQPMRG